MHAGDLLVLNVDKEGSLKVYGNTVKDIPGYIAKEAQASLLAARRSNPKIQAGDDLPTTVVVRADKETRFKQLESRVGQLPGKRFSQFFAESRESQRCEAAGAEIRGCQRPSPKGMKETMR